MTSAYSRDGFGYGRPNLATIGFDADDTLWQNEKFFRIAQERFTALLSDFAEPDILNKTLLETEISNLKVYGFGVKSFILSMIETALHFTGHHVPEEIVNEILETGKELKSYPVELIPGAREAVERLAGSVNVILLSKGDLFDQERKLAQSGLVELFDGVEIVSDKTSEVYVRVFQKYGARADNAMMVGNSLKSDIVPALSAGSWAVFVPHELTWEYEHAELPSDAPRFIQLPRIGELPELVADRF
ncbi:MAG: HAD hydrolase-like protein [Albidovulum sp.]|nr:HAD hydrolase-like protein [Albidovulum sp.]